MLVNITITLWSRRKPLIIATCLPSVKRLHFGDTQGDEEGGEQNPCDWLYPSLPQAGPVSQIIPRPWIYVWNNLY